MTLFHWFLFILSAFLYPAPLLWSSYCWPLVFVFAIPLLYVATYNNLSFAHGIVWGIITFSSHLWGVFWGIDTIAQGSILARITPAFILISICGMYGALWFTFNKKIINFFSLHSPIQRLMFWILSYFIFIFMIEHFAFITLGRYEGHYLFNPIIVLSAHPQFLTLLPYLGKTILTFLIICFSGSLVYLVIQKNMLSIILFSLFSAPWLISFAIPLPKKKQPDWISKIYYLPAKISDDTNENAVEHITKAQDLFQRAVSENPDTEVIIMPESAMFCDLLSKEALLCTQWAEHELGKPLHIITGAFRWDGPYYRNTLHWFFNGKLMHLYDKRHAMLLTEAIPECCKFKLLEETFFRNFPGITPSTNERPQLEVLNGVTFIPYICSELFFNDTPDDSYGQRTTILSITNDIWCKDTNIKNLLYLSARFKAILWQRNILYISYFHSKYFDIYGNEIDLQDWDNPHDS